jgi:hypothetical protein
MSGEIGRFRSIVIAAGGVAAVFGLYWDDAWHTDVGRDTFFAPPHLLLYAGVSVLLVTLAVWTWQRYRVEGQAVLRDPTLLLPLGGASVTLAAAPVDDVWHQLFGRDAVTWSPPHMVAAAGMAAFAAGLFLLATRPNARSPQLVSPVIGAFLIAAVVTVVMEFETDVPQFPELLYLPVKLAALTFAFGLISQASARPWGVTQAAAVYVVLRVGVVGFLAVLGHSLPTVMPTAIAAWGFELALRRGASRWGIAAATTVAAVGSHVAAHALQPAGLALTGQEAAVGAVLGALGSWAVLAALGVGGTGRTAQPARVARTAASALLVVLVVGSAGPVFAHDPGQGEEVAPVELTTVRDGDRLEVEVTASGGSCAAWNPVRVVARRAGRSPVGPLTVVDACRFAGTVHVDDPGRWFVYAEMEVEGRRTEAWLPVEDGKHSKDTVLYVAAADGADAVQVVAGVALYLLAFAILAAVVVAYRRVTRAQPVTPASAVALSVPQKVYR